MEMSVQEFLNSISNPRTRKGYRFGLNKFVEWFSKPAEDILFNETGRPNSKARGKPC